MAERVYCLYRVSTSKQVDHDDQNQADIPMQRKACHDFADKMGWIIVGEEKETGVSGYKVSADDRDKLQLIKKYAEQGKFDILLVFMFDRLGRKSDETPFVVEWFAKKGVRVWSVKEGEQRFESHTDRLTNYIRFWQADGESQKTSMRTKTALGQMVEEGRFRGGNASYGYRLEKSGILNKRKHEVYMLVIDEDEARVVRMMFDLCVSSGYGRWRLANFLNDHGIKNRKGQNWHDASVGGILHTPNVEFSFDVAITTKNKNGNYMRLIHNKNVYALGLDQYTWNEVPNSHQVKDRADKLKRAGLWQKVRDRYLEKKNMYLFRPDHNHPSFVVYVEAVNEVYSRYFNRGGGYSVQSIF